MYHLLIVLFGCQAIWCAYGWKTYGLTGTKWYYARYPRFVEYPVPSEWLALTFWLPSIYFSSLTELTPPTLHVTTSFGDRKLKPRRRWHKKPTERPNYTIYKFEVRSVRPPVREPISRACSPFAVQYIALGRVATSITPPGRQKNWIRIFGCWPENFLS